jgi:DNA-directed RNA polymerase subunit RPC12/RpoP
MVQCLICKKRFKQITTSGHLRKHNITRAEYLQQFPSATTVSDDTKSAHSKAMKQHVKDGDHFVPFRDIDGFAQKVHDKHKEGPIEYKCIQCGKIKQANRYVAERRKFCTNQCHSDHIKENPNLYIERNKRISDSNFGRPKRPKNANPYSRCKGGYREGIGQYVRSGWEADICRIFQYHECEYEYERILFS